MKHNRLKRELDAYKALGFEGGNPSSIIKNPTLRLTDGSCLIGMAGGLVGRATTTTHFRNHQHLKLWKSSNRNDPYATMTSTQLDPDGVGKHTEIYYRENNKEIISAMARAYTVSEDKIVCDHVNHKRGDCRDENIEFGTTRQNNLNRRPKTNEGAFWTIDEVKAKLESGEWVAIKSKPKKQKVIQEKPVERSYRYTEPDSGFSDEYISYREYFG